MSSIIETNLPTSWKLVRLGDIAKTSSGGTPRRDRPQFYGGKIPWVKSGELGDSVVYETSETITEEAIESSNAKVFPKGTLCIALYGATVGKLGILGIDAATNQAVCAIFPPDGLDTRYLYRFFESIRRGLVEQGKGGAQPNISQAIIRDTQIPLAPLPEQRRIVAEIEKQFTRLEASVAALRRVQANLKRYRAAVLKAACEGQLVPTEADLHQSSGTGQKRFESGEQLLKRILSERRQNWTGRGKYKEPKQPDIANLAPLPPSWTWVSWEMVLASADGAFKRGPFGSALTKSLFVEKGFKVYEQYCPINDDCSFGRYYITPEKFEELKAFEVKAGDYLISCSGVSLGRITRVPEQYERGVINQALLRVRLDEKIINHRYFLHLFRSAFFQKAIFDNSIGSAIPNVKGVKELKAMAIPLPSLAEQTRVVAEVERRLSVLEELESTVTANLQRAIRLRRSILQKAFSGELL